MDLEQEREGAAGILPGIATAVFSFSKKREATL